MHDPSLSPLPFPTNSISTRPNFTSRERPRTVFSRLFVQFRSVPARSICVGLRRREREKKGKNRATYCAVGKGKKRKKEGKKCNRFAIRKAYANTTRRAESFVALNCTRTAFVAVSSTFRPNSRPKFVPQRHNSGALRRRKVARDARLVTCLSSSSSLSHLRSRALRTPCRLIRPSARKYISDVRVYSSVARAFYTGRFFSSSVPLRDAAPGAIIGARFRFTLYIYIYFVCTCTYIYINGWRREEAHGRLKGQRRPRGAEDRAQIFDKSSWRRVANNIPPLLLFLHRRKLKAKRISIRLSRIARRRPPRAGSNQGQRDRLSCEIYCRR